MKRLIDRLNYWYALLEDCKRHQSTWRDQLNGTILIALPIYRDMCKENYELYTNLRKYICKRIEKVYQELFAQLAYDVFTDPRNWGKHIDIKGFDMVIETGHDENATYYEITIGGQTNEI